MSAPTSQERLDLASLQREMAAAVMQPLTKDENMRATASDGRPMAEVAGSFIAPNSRLTAFERLEIYNRQYWYRILGALAEDFPALRALIGAERFDALSIAYLTEHPSRSFTLRNLGSKLPEWLIVHPDYAGRRHRLAVDLARMEWAFVEAFDAPERESAHAAPDRRASGGIEACFATMPAIGRAQLPGRQPCARVASTREAPDQRSGSCA